METVLFDVQYIDISVGQGRDGGGGLGEEGREGESSAISVASCRYRPAALLRPK